MWGFRQLLRSKTFCQLNLALWLLLSFQCFAQTKKIDSLKSLLPKIRSTARIECLYEVGIQYLIHHQKDSALYYERVVYEESEKINYKRGLALAYLLKATMAIHFYNDFLQTAHMAREAIQLFNQASDKRKIPIAYWQLSYAQSKLSNYDEALKNAEKCYVWAKRTGEEKWIGSALETMTDIFRERGEYVKLFEAQQELIKRDRLLGDNRDTTTHELWVLGLMYRLLEEYPTALSYWRKLFIESGFGFLNSWNHMEYAELLTEANLPDSALYYYNLFDSAKAKMKDLRFFLVSKGEYYLFKKKFRTALPYFMKGLSHHRQVNDHTQVKRIILDIAKTYAALRKNDSAIHYAHEGLAMALQTRSKPSIRDGYKILYTVYEHLGRPDSAYHYYRNYINMKEAVMDDQTKGKLATYNYEHKIKMLGKEKQLQLQQIEKATLQQKILLFGIAGIFLLAFFVLRNILWKRRNEINRRRLAEHELQLQKLESERTKSELQQKATELEMQALRAQMNPHFIFNSLNSINRFILQNNKEHASAYLTKFSRLVRLILQNSQLALIPLESELEALRLYLELEALRFDYHFDYTITIEEELDTSSIKVPPLIIQPYAENAIWHGLMHKPEKGRLDVALSQQGTFLFCKITDDGIGRIKAAELKSKSASAYKSIGMRITADRIALSQPNNQKGPYVSINDLILPDGTAEGTEVTIKIPVHYD